MGVPYKDEGTSRDSSFDIFFDMPSYLNPPHSSKINTLTGHKNRTFQGRWGTITRLEVRSEYGPGNFTYPTMQKVSET
jgi:hypothetical protein